MDNRAADINFSRVSRQQGNERNIGYNISEYYKSNSDVGNSRYSKKNNVRSEETFHDGKINKL